jgi:hypothetical protein
MPPGFLDPTDLAGHLTGEEIEWYEDRFLMMQREIFDDLAWQHEAFVLGGVPLMREIASRYPTEMLPRDIDAWEGIGSGDAERIKDGNTDLLLREQERVIQDDYDAMRDHHGPVGDVFTCRSRPGTCPTSTTAGAGSRTTCCPRTTSCSRIRTPCAGSSRATWPPGPPSTASSPTSTTPVADDPTQRPRRVPRLGGGRVRQLRAGVR